jgi:hypothetical protein
MERYGARPGDIAQQRTTIEAELRRLTSEIDVLYGHLASGLASVRDQILERERRQADLRGHLDRLDALAKLPTLDRTGLTHELRQRLTDWRALLDAEPVKARQTVRKLVPERIVFTPDPTQRLYTFKGQAAYGRLLTGTVLQNGWCPRGDSNTRHAV